MSYQHPNKQPHVVVIGSAGYTGSHVAEFFYRNNYRVTGIDQQQHNHPSSACWSSHMHQEVHGGADLITILKEEPVDMVVVCIAPYFSDQDLYAHHTLFIADLIKTLAHYNVSKLICFSRVYNPCASDQNTTTAIRGRHARHEQTLLTLCAAYAIEIVLFRLFGVSGTFPEYGLHEWHVPETHFVPLLVQAAYSQTPTLLQYPVLQDTDHMNSGEFVHPWDIGYACVKAYEYLSAQGRSAVCDLSNGTWVSSQDIVNTVEQVCATPLQNCINPSWHERAACLESNSQATKDLLGWSAPYSTIDFIVKSVAVSLSEQQKLLAPADTPVKTIH
ncbi:hypothetical protein J120_04560 [candidate division TM6 bacterium JCVI TM6SC1]|uniref:UDP-glucose 4-epimerase n=1 Tax=candidate division TM6 bacterium JCVI TM6SC1 TaxID=1306947 RepID=A0A0D2JDD8_9BACT|nr:hypothetical protein J120_04560 [candidate division TM6 bacterium JCVI TM6SC1]